MIFYFVRLFLSFQFALIFTFKFFDALCFVFYPPLDFGYFAYMNGLQKCTYGGDIGIFNFFKSLSVFIVKIYKCLFF